MPHVCTVSPRTRTTVRLRAASLLAACLVVVAAPMLGAQGTTTIQKPRIDPTHATIVKPAQPTVSKVPPVTLTTWEGSLQVSIDGVHWGTAASTSWANPCPETPAGCGQNAPAIPVHLRWQARDNLVPAYAMAALNGTYYYYHIQSQLSGPSSPAPAAVCDAYGATSGLAASNQYDAHAQPNLKPGDSMVCSYTVRTRDASGKFYDTAPVTFTIHVTAAHP